MTKDEFLHMQLGRLWLRLVELEYDISVLKGRPDPEPAPPSPKE